MKHKSWLFALCRDKIDGLVQERRNSSALAMELRLSCINPSKWYSGCLVSQLASGIYTLLWYIKDNILNTGVKTFPFASTNELPEEIAKPGMLLKLYIGCIMAVNGIKQSVWTPLGNHNMHEKLLLFYDGSNVKSLI